MKRTIGIMAIWAMTSTLSLAEPEASPADTTRTLLRSNILRLKAKEGKIEIEKHYLLAGANQFRGLWARDLSMATIGVLQIGETKVIHDSLELILALQREDGLLPYLVDHIDVYWRLAWKYFGLEKIMDKLWRRFFPMRAWYVTENRIAPIDTNLVIPWAVAQYVKETADVDFAKKWLPNIQKAIFYVETNHLEDGLLGKQLPFSDWKDSVGRTGKVTFTNLLYRRALEGAASLANASEHIDEAILYENKEQKLRQDIRSFFWDSERNVFNDFVGSDSLTADANLLAIVDGILPESEARALLVTLQESPLWNPLPGRASYPDYPTNLKSGFVQKYGMLEYHDSMVWLWISALAARAEAAVGDCAGYQGILDEVGSKITADGTVYEVLEPGPECTLPKALAWATGICKSILELRPVKRRFYQAEHPFTWSAAMYLEALSQGCSR